jgi:hypothetical protein
MLRNIAFIVVGTLGFLLSAIPSQAQQDYCSCVRKADGRVVCGFFDRYGNMHPSECRGYRKVYIGRPDDDNGGYRREYRRDDRDDYREYRKGW